MVGRVKVAKKGMEAWGKYKSKRQNERIIITKESTQGSEKGKKNDREEKIRTEGREE